MHIQRMFIQHSQRNTTMALQPLALYRQTLVMAIAMTIAMAIAMPKPEWGKLASRQAGNLPKCPADMAIVIAWGVIKVYI